ncbi:MAG: hypothetical protein Q4E61_02865 [Alphaproteobacteria bacterium]|nr:hypothetical protein [Alphaproteobacteria bacterium]
MNNKTPLIISIIIHIIVISLSYTNLNNLFRSKMKSSNYAVFDFVQIGEKSKAPILSDVEGKLSKTKAKTSEKETVNQSTQPTEASNEKSKKDEMKSETKNKKDDKAISLKNKKKEKAKSEKKKSKADQSSKSNEKAIVNLRKNKSKKNTDSKAAKKSFDSLLDGAIANGDNENSGIKAEEVGEVLTATQIDLIRQTIRKCWHFPAGLKNAEDLIVDIEMELDQEGNVTKAKIVDTSRMNTDPDYRTAAENAYRAVLDPECNPLPLPKEKYEEWKNLELSFNPKEMFE